MNNLSLSLLSPSPLSVSSLAPFLSLIPASLSLIPPSLSLSLANEADEDGRLHSDDADGGDDEAGYDDIDDTVCDETAIMPK